jgi:6-pyruvoyl-tetrahydropterin synthase
MDDKLKKYYEFISELFLEYEQIKQEMENFVNTQKKFYEQGHIYLELKKCGTKGCFFCPHGFVWVISVNFGKDKKLKRKELGKEITKDILRKYNKTYLYKKMKELENTAKNIEAKRKTVLEIINNLNSNSQKFYSYKESKIKLENRDWISVAEAVSLLNLSKVSIYKKIKNDAIEYKKIDGKYYIRK